MVEIPEDAERAIRKVARASYGKLSGKSSIALDDIEQDLREHYLSSGGTQRARTRTLLEARLNTVAKGIEERELRWYGMDSATFRREHVVPRYRYDARLIRATLRVMYRIDPSRWVVTFFSDRPNGLSQTGKELAQQVYTALDALGPEDRGAIAHRQAGGPGNASERSRYARAVNRLTEIINAKAWLAMQGEHAGARRAIGNATARALIGKQWE